MRIGFIAVLASLCVFTSAQVVPSRPVVSGTRTQSVLPDAHNQNVSHKPDAQESKNVLREKADRSRGYIENKGQWPSNVRFLGRSNGLDLWVTDEGLRFNAYSRSQSQITGHVVGVKFVGSKGLKPVGQDSINLLTDFINAGNSVRGAKTYKTVSSADVYPKIILKNYFDGTRPRYDLVVKPHGDPSQIKMSYIASEGVTVKPQSLEIKTSVGAIVESKLLAYQIVSGKKKTVAAAFQKTGKDQVGFKLGKYDHSKPLIIDPVLIYGSYYGGDSGWDEVHAIVSDLLGGVYMTGRTSAVDFPRIYGPYSLNLSGGFDAFVSKLEGDAYRHDYAAFLGGTKNDSGEFLQLDQYGDLWVCGYTASGDFPGAAKHNIQYIAYDYNKSMEPTGPLASPPNQLRRVPVDPPFDTVLPWSSPAGNATFRMALPGLPFSPQIRWDASPASLQAALQAYINQYRPGNTVAVTDVSGVHGDIADGRGYKIDITNNNTGQPPVIGEFIVDSNNLGARYNVARSMNGRAQVITQATDVLPQTGTFRLAVPYARAGGSFVGTTVSLPFNASPAQVQTALNTMPADPADPNQTAVNMQAIVRTDVQGNTGQLPANGIVMLFRTAEPQINLINESLDSPLTVVIAGIDDYYWDPTSSPPTGAAPGYPGLLPNPNPDGETFNLAYSGVWSVPTVAYNTNAQKLHDAIGSVGAPPIGANNVVVIPDAGVGNMPTTSMAAVFVKNLLGTFPGPAQVTDDPVIVGSVLNPTPPVEKSEGRTNPRPVYSVHSEQGVYVMRFKQDATTELNPLPTTVYFFGGDVAPNVTGFRIIPHANPAPGDPVRLTMAGTCYGSAAEIPTVTIYGKAAPRNSVAGFILRVNWTSSTGFQVIGGLNTSPTHYVDSDAFPVEINGIDVDANGNVYVGGTIQGDKGDTIDTSQQPDVFVTTPVDPLGTLRDARLLRWLDQFARKYNSSGALTYSVLIGGDGPDTGNGIAIDGNGDAYLLGVSNSFNFPRTRGVYGETFTQATLSTICKINPSASDLIYGTHLHTSCQGTAPYITPVGIAVDARGIAYATFHVSRGTIILPWTVDNDPNIPSGFEFIGSVPTTADALKSTYTEANNGGDYGSVDGALLVLNASGTQLIYGTYLGGVLDDQIYPPYVDKGGDVWYCGWTDTYRAYYRYGRWHPVIRAFRPHSTLPGTMISPLAFRPTPDPTSGFVGPGTQYAGFDVYNTEFDNYPYFWDSYRDRDGFVGRLRIGSASVSNLGFSPATIPGGLGASSTGTVTLSTPAPAGGAVVILTIPPSEPGTFDAAGTLRSTSLTIAAGATSGTFKVFSQPVADNSFVDVTASYQGNFKVGRLVVVPWLQSFSVIPTEIVGGNTAVGKIQLSGVTGSGGLTLTVTSDTPSVAQPVSSTVKVPAGQSSVAFNIPTTGVDQDITVTLNASLLGVGKPVTLIVHPAQLQTVTFSPNPVTSGTSVTGTVTITGNPGATGFDVDLSVVGAPAGYTITPTTLHFASGQTSQTFTMTTPYESQTVIRTVSATMEPTPGYTPNTVNGQLTVQAAAVTSLTLDQTTVNGGTTVHGQVTISTAALAGGATVDLAVSPANGTVTLPTRVTIPGGTTTATFNITTTSSITQQVFTITASRGTSSQSQTLTVNALNFTITAPSVVASGGQATGTITLNGPAPAGGIAVKMTSSNPAVLPIPTPITIAAGQTSATFPIHPTAVNSDTDVQVSAQIGTTSHFVTITVHPSQVIGLTIMPNYVLNLQSVRFTITLDGPAPAGGLVVFLTSSIPSIAAVPAQVTIPAGQSSLSFSVATKRVALPLKTTIQANGANGGTAIATLTVHP